MQTESELQSPMTMVFAANWFVGKRDLATLREHLNTELGDDRAKVVVDKFSKWQNFCDNPEGELE